jgi:hypothetical protein
MGRNGKRIAGATIGLALVGLFGGLTSASAAETLVFQAGKQKIKVVDLGKKGPSRADRLYVRVPLLKDGQPAGTVNAVCEQISKSRLFCTNEITVDGRGELMAEGFQNLKSPVVIDPVTGGTGQFSGMGGQATVDFSTGTMTIELVP